MYRLSLVHEFAASHAHARCTKACDGSKFETVLDFVDRAVLDYPYRLDIGTYSFSVKIHFNFLATQWKSRIGAFFMVF